MRGGAHGGEGEGDSARSISSPRSGPGGFIKPNLTSSPPSSTAPSCGCSKGCQRVNPRTSGVLIEEPQDLQVVLFGSLFLQLQVVGAGDSGAMRQSPELSHEGHDAEVVVEPVALDSVRRHAGLVRVAVEGRLAAKTGGGFPIAPIA